jgi:hypothetical protein
VKAASTAFPAPAQKMISKIRRPWQPNLTDH